MDTTTLSSQVRQMWETRPLRARRAPIAGVCTGFARRYQVDVALVRAAFIGATVLGGIGFIAYIVGVFVLPKEPHREYHQAERGGPPTLVLIIAAVLAVTFGGGLGSSWPGAGLISAALLLAGWYALHQRTPIAPAGTAVSSQFFDAGPAMMGAWQPPASPFPWQPAWQPPVGTDPSGAVPTNPAPAQPQPVPPQPEPTAEPAPAPAPAPEQASMSLTKDEQPTVAQPAPAPNPQALRATQTTEQIHPPRWDPLGAAPFAWDLPEPAPSFAPAPLPQPKSRVTAVTLGVALLTAAAIAALNVIGLASISPVLAASIVLGVIGAGLLYGAFRRSGYGLLIAAIPLAGFIVIGATAQNVMAGYVDAPRGDQSITVTTAADLQDKYKLQAGTLTLDLSRLTLDRDRQVETRVAAGETRITVPESMNVRVTCDVNVGDTECPQGLTPGVGAKPGAPTLTIDARGNVGSVEVNRVR